MTDENRTANASVDRRSLITKAAAAAGVGWTAPVVLGSVHSPAAAATCIPCVYVTYTAPLAETTANPAFLPPGTCSGGSAVTATATDVGLTATGGPISHAAANPGNINPVVLTVDPLSDYIIVDVRGKVHQIGPPTGPPDCPDPPYQIASTAFAAPLQITAGALGSKSVTVQPNQNPGAVCNFFAANPRLHWGDSLGGAPPGEPGSGLVVTLECAP